MSTSVKTRPVLWDLLPLLLVLLLAAGLFFGFWGGKEEGGSLTAVISIGGEEVERMSLLQLTQEQVYTPQGLAYPLRIALDREGVRVMDSACPGGDCLHTGTIHRAGESIVCLPNQLMVRLEGGGESIDAVIG